MFVKFERFYNLYYCIEFKFQKPCFIYCIRSFSLCKFLLYYDKSAINIL